jgi:predicted phage tail protein
VTSTQQPVSHRRARPTTIVWGAILVAGSVFALVVLLGGPLSASSVLWSLVGFGGVLIVAAVVTAIVRAVQQQARRQTPDEDHPPVG